MTRKDSLINLISSIPEGYMLITEEYYLDSEGVPTNEIRGIHEFLMLSNQELADFIDDNFDTELYGHYPPDTGRTILIDRWRIQQIPDYLLPKE